MLYYYYDYYYYDYFIIRKHLRGTRYEYDDPITSDRAYEY